MRARRLFQAVSLDFWYTALYPSPGADARLGERRVRFLRENLILGDGQSPELFEIERAIESVDTRLGAEGKDPIEVDPQSLTMAYAAALGARPVQTPGELGKGYSVVGFADDPPQVNPEAPSFVAALEERGIPVIAITNTSRPETTWQEFLRSRTYLNFRYVVTSCDVGHAKPHPAIFAAAAKRLGVSLGEILHVGDRWELDVSGALGAGCGAALYTGLWHLYPNGMYPDTDLEEVRRSGIPCIRRLNDLLTADLRA